MDDAIAKCLLKRLLPGLGTVAIGVAVSLIDARVLADPPPPTFNRDIAPIIFANCSQCHRPDQSAPFSLLSFEDVKKRGRQIAQVTQSHFMPPWLAEPGTDCVNIVGERRLTAAQIALIRQWVEGGMAEGEVRDLPALPVFENGWKLGEPDLVLTLPEPYTIPAEPRDTIRTFVFPVTLPFTSVVKAIDFDPGNQRAVHHVSFLADKTGTARQLDALDAAPGYGSMADIGFNLAGSFGTWSPGGLTPKFPTGIGRTIPKDCDLTVEIHFNPTGKPEVIQPRVALYFVREQVEHRVVSCSLGSSYIDIPADEKEFKVHDEMLVPVNSMLLGVSPHAHYTCRTMRLTASLPDGTVRRLLEIKDWDFNWQQEYRYQEPLELPAGTKVELDFVYDNSAGNPRNPNNPPKRMRSGATASDEMAILFLNLIATNEQERSSLEKAKQDKLLERLRDAQRKRALEQTPDSGSAKQRGSN